MIGARTNTLATLRGASNGSRHQAKRHALNRVALGHAGADAVLQGGLATARCTRCLPRDGRAARRQVSSRALPGG